MSTVEELVAAAKSWRGLAKLVVLVLAEGAEQVQEVVVKLGPGRRRWKRVATAIAPLDDGVVGARGYDDAGELVGAWDAPTDDDEDDAEERAVETDAMAAHRSHTQWVMREVSKMFETSIRLNIEMAGAVIELVRGVRGQAGVATATQEPTTDEASKTLGLLLQTVMAGNNNNNRSDDGEEERDARRTHGDAGGQGQQAESGQAGA